MRCRSGNVMETTSIRDGHGTRQRKSTVNARKLQAQHPLHLHLLPARPLRPLPTLSSRLPPRNPTTRNCHTAKTKRPLPRPRPRLQARSLLHPSHPRASSVVVFSPTAHPDRATVELHLDQLLDLLGNLNPPRHRDPPATLGPLPRPLRSLLPSLALPAPLPHQHRPRKHPALDPAIPLPLATSSLKAGRLSTHPVTRSS